MVKNSILIIMLLTATIILFIGCERHVAFKTPSEPAPVDGPVPTALKVALGDALINLSWAPGDGEQAVAEYRIFIADSLGRKFTLFDSTATRSINFSSLTLNQKYWFRIAAVFTDGQQGYLSEAVTARFARLNIMINSGSEFTKQQQVIVIVNSSENVSHIMLSETDDFSDSLWFPAVSQNQYQVDAGDGLKTIYAHLVFRNGATTVEPLVDTIILDTYVAIDEVSFYPILGTRSAGDTINFFIETGEIRGEASISFTGSGTIDLHDLGTDPDEISGDGKYSGFWVVPHNILLEDAEVSGEFTDAAGNRISNVVAKYRLNIDSTPSFTKQSDNSQLEERRP